MNVQPHFWKNFVAKPLRVVKSCKTLAQLVSAENYVMLSLTKLKREYSISIREYSFIEGYMSGMINSKFHQVIAYEKTLRNI
jgi:hypothetical protein